MELPANMMTPTVRSLQWLVYALLYFIKLIYRPLLSVPSKSMQVSKTSKLSFVMKVCRQILLSNTSKLGLREHGELSFHQMTNSDLMHVISTIEHFFVGNSWTVRACKYIGNVRPRHHGPALFADDCKVITKVHPPRTLNSLQSSGRVSPLTPEESA
jgi:hypothetical protein